LLSLIPRKPVFGTRALVDRGAMTIKAGSGGFAPPERIGKSRHIKTADSEEP